MADLKIVIADDAAVIRDQLLRVFCGIEGLSLIGMAANGEEAVRMIQVLNPDLAILDISMPLKSGLEVLREIRRDDPAVTIIMFSAYQSEVLRDACLSAGADHYVDKADLLVLVEICKNKLLAN